jgi:hypothetical protein
MTFRGPSEVATESATDVTHQLKTDIRVWIVTKVDTAKI